MNRPFQQANNNYTTRLNRDKYERPQTTFQETLTKDDIKEKLIGYEKVADISKVPINTHIRYFSYVEDPATRKVNKVFRMGGFLYRKENADQYVVLSNGKSTWSVNSKKSCFFRKMKPEEVQAKYLSQISELKETVRSLKHQLGGSGVTK